MKAQLRAHCGALQVVWAMGLCVYSSCNVWYIIALSYCPLSLGIALFSC